MINRLFYKKPASVWQEALVLGNGRIGALLFGSLEKEHIALNEDTLWSGYPKHHNNYDACQFLGDIRKEILEGNHENANRINNEQIKGYWSDCYLPFGDIYIDYQNNTGNHFERSLDLSTGVAQVTNSLIKETVFVSHVSQLLVINIKSENNISFSLSFTSPLSHEVLAKDNTLILKGQAPEICYPPYIDYGENIIYGEKGMRFCGAVKIIGKAEFRDDKIWINDQKETTILVSLATGFINYNSMPTADAEKRALTYFSNQKTYDILLKEHIADFSSLFNRVSVDFGVDRYDVPTDTRLTDFKNGVKDDNLIALLFQFGRYLTISGSRPGTTAMNLQGIWNTEIRAPWSSNYTVNINTEMNYWCTDICNLSECFSPFAELVKEMCINGCDSAKAYYSCGGAVAHHNVDIWAQTCPAGDHLGKTNTVSYALWNSSLPWMLSQAYEHYRYTKDEKYIEELRPCFAKVLQFYKEFLISHNGVNITCPSISPENTYIDHGTRGNLTYMPTMDIGILEDFFNCCSELGFANIPELPPIPIGSDGRINEWVKEYEESEIEHRHVSHLYCVYPSGVEQGDNIKEACKKSLIVRGMKGTGWALGWKACLWARLGEPEKVLELIRNQLYPIDISGKDNYPGGGSYPNLLDAHPPFQIDGNFGISAAIAEMFVCGKVPQSWTGYAKGIKQHNGKILNVSFSNGKVHNLSDSI